MPEPSTPALEMRGISKRFGASLALDCVDFTLLPGEIHALLGENGAGKSTLMNIVRGLISPTQGEILVHGESRRFANPRDAARAGIGMVHQHFLLVPTFTATENLALAAQDTGWHLTLDAIRARAEATAARLGWIIPLETRVADLPVGTQQRVEILKALMGDARILLFDEPTAVLAPGEVGELLAILRVLREEGRSLVFVTHKLSEVLALCDRVSVLRRGRMAGTTSIADTDAADMARRMVGTDVVDILDESPALLARAAQPVLEVAHLHTSPGPDAVALRDITFSLAPGEILGIAGVDGNGQTELAEALTGLRPWISGTVTLSNHLLPRLRPEEMVTRGIAYIPPDRQTQGLALTLSVEENLTLEASRMGEFNRGPFINQKLLSDFAARTARDFDIRAENLQTPARALSGGNQQKIVIARALWRKPALLVAVSPTRGLDIAASAYVRRKLRDRQREGGAVLLLSTELEEIIALSTRIAVLYEGRMVGIVPSSTSRETLGLMMGGRT